MCDCWYIYDRAKGNWYCECCGSVVSDGHASKHNKDKYQNRTNTLQYDIHRQQRLLDKATKIEQLVNDFKEIFLKKD